MKRMSLKFAVVALLMSATAAMAEGARGSAPVQAHRAASHENGQSGAQASPLAGAALQQSAPGADSQPTEPPLTREVGDNEIQVGRYTTESTLRTAAASDPLRVVAIVHFPREVVRSVGDAVKYLLVRTGYELVDVRTLDPHVQRIFSLRLPDAQRVVGPSRVADMLGTLMGPAFIVDADAANRTVGYRLSVAAATGAAAVPVPAVPAGTATNPIDATVATAMPPAR